MLFKKNNKEWGRMNVVSTYHKIQQEDSENPQQSQDLAGAG